MKKLKILILGISGMLGSSLFRILSNSPDYEIWGSLRDKGYLNFFSDREKIVTDINILDEYDLIKLFASVKPDIVINCIGIIKQHSSSKNPLVVLPINSLLPYRLSELCKLLDARLILVSTDCVFSGKKGNYTEEDISDAEDLYGKSKFIGEIHDQKHVLTIRTSIIGHELKSNYSLVDWFLSKENSVKGFSAVKFSGLPAIEIANIINNLIIPDTSLNGLYHISSNQISKYELLLLIKNQYKKQIDIIKDSDIVIDRSLDSEKFFKATGYVVPNWEELIRNLYNYKLAYMEVKDV